MSGIGESIATDAVKGAACWLAGEARYCCLFDTYIEGFGEAKDKLESTIENVKERAERANQNTEKIGGHVSKGLEKAQALIGKAEKLDQQVKNKNYCFGRCPNLICQYFLGRKAEKLTSLMKEHNGELKENKQFAQLKSLKHGHTSENFFDSKNATLAYKQLWEALEDKRFNKIGLYGMGGCGKTTLLNKLAEVVQNSNVFQRVAFAVVSNHPNIRNIQGSIANWLNLKFDLEEGERERAKRLRMRLTSEEKILVILDDVWRKLEYEDIGIPSGPNQKNCTILIATRSRQVCILMDCQKEINLELLNAEEALILFKKHAGIVNEDPDSLKSVQAQEISNKCRGLPIAIAAVGSSLREKTTGDWKRALQKFRDHEPVDIEDGVINPYICLQSSYDNLKGNKEAKDLFLLCSLYPEDSEIQVEDLVRSGSGLGIFGKFDSYQEARDKVNSSVNRLICSSMLLQGKEGQSVIMHDLFRSLALRIAKEEIQVIMGSGKVLKAYVNDETAKYIIRYLYCHNIDEFPDQLDFPRLEILFVFMDGTYSSKVSDTFFKGMKGLKVLSVIDKSSEQTSTFLLSPSVQLLINLQTLCLKGCKLDKIHFLGDLAKLETLEFCECTITEFSYQIAELRKLRLLDVSRCRIGGNPYKVLVNCSHLKELYFLQNDLSNVKPRYRNFADFLDKERSSFQKLQCYHVQIGSYIDDVMGKGGKRSKILSLCHFKASTANATVKDLVQRTEVLFLKEIYGGCKSIIPDIVETGGMNELIELLLCESDEIECAIDASRNLYEDGTVFSKLNKLRIQNMKNLEALCQGEPPAGLFEGLEELQISKCSQMKSKLFQGELKLHRLKVLELNQCQSLSSLASVVIARSLLRLQVLKITNCNNLKHIIEDEGSEIVSDDKAVFPKLEVLHVIHCNQLEYLIPVSLALGLEQLESLVIYQAPMLKYVFGQSELRSSNQNLNKPKKIELPALKQLELVDLTNITSICSKDHYLSWPSLPKPDFRGCPGLSSSSAYAAGVGSDSDVGHGDDKHSKQVDIGITTVMKNLTYGTIRQARYCFCFDSLTEDFTKAVRQLKSTVETIRYTVDAATRETGEIIAPDVQNWLDEAGHLIEEVEGLQEISERRKDIPNWIWQFRLGKQMEKKRKAIIELNAKNKFHQFVSPLPVIPSKHFIHFKSRKLAYDEILEAFKDDQISMIALYGLGGCGKSMLAREVAKEAKQALIFDKVVFVVFATVAQSRDVKKIQGEIADSLDIQLKEKDESERARRLFLRLTSGQKILIVLDGLWEGLDLEAIGIPFGRLHHRCCVLLTSRSLTVCNLMDCQRTIPLSLLTEDEAWFMFQKHAGLTDDIPATSRAMALEISNKCAGLPILIDTVARALSSKPLYVWQDALIRLKETDDEGTRQVVYSALSLSYDNLSEQAKSLLLLCSIFPEDYEIPREMLTRYAIGLGLFGKIETYEGTRKRVQLDIDLLIGYSLLLEGYEKGYVTMHCVVRDAALLIAKGQLRVVMESEWIQEELDSEVRYLWCDKVNELTVPLESGELELLYIQTDLVKDEFLLETRILRVLALRNRNAEKISVLHLSKSVEWLKNLRCLLLHGWELGNLSFIGSFIILESLILQHCSFDKLPSEILQLTTLRLLELSECIIEEEPYQLIGRCSQLEEFYFTGCHNSKWKLQGDNSAELFGENSNLSLKRYHIEVGETFGLFDRVVYYVSKGLSVQYFDPSTSDETTNDLIQRAEVLNLKEIKGGCKNIIPDIVQTVGGMDELVELLLCDSAKIECLIDTARSFPPLTVLPNLLKLRIESMEHMEFLCRGQPPLELFSRLEELHMKTCFQMHGILSAGKLNLSSLKILDLHDCPMLMSLFSTAVAQTLVLLEVLKVTQCNGLKCIIADEEEEKKDEIESLEHNSHELEFSKLKQIVIQNCKQLEYMFGQYNHEGQSSYQNGKKAIKVIELPVLDQLRLEQLPNMAGIFPKNYNINWPALHDFYLLDCPQLNMGTINNCTVGIELRRHGNTTSKNDVKFIKNLGSLAVKNTQVESIFQLDGLSNDGEPVTSGLTLLDLYVLPKLRHICKGPKHFLSLQNLEELQIEGCGKLEFVFSTSLMRSFLNLKILKIINCQKLEQITEEDVEYPDQLSNLGSQDVCFPKLIILFVSNCNKLRRLFSVTTSHEFLKLKSLIIMGASELKELFGCERGDKYEDMELVLNLEHLILIELPRLINVSQGIQKDVEYRVMRDCPQLGLNSNSTLEQLYKKFEGEDNGSVEYGHGLHGKLFRLLQTIEDNKGYTPVRASSESEYEQNDNDIAPIASPNLTENIKQKMEGTTGNVPALEIPGVETSTDSEMMKALQSSLTVPLRAMPSSSNTEAVKQFVPEPKNLRPAPPQEVSPQRIEVNVEESPMSQNVSMVASTAHDSKSGSSTPKHWFEKSPEALEETNETPRLDKPSNLPQKTSSQGVEGKVSTNTTINTNEQNIDGSAEGSSQINEVAISANSEPGTLIHSPQGQIRPRHTDIYNQEDAETDPIKLQDFNDDDLIILLQSIKDDDDDDNILVSVPFISGIPAEHPFHRDKQLAQAIANLEASLKIPLNDIANSKTRIIHLEKTLNFLSSHCWEDGVLFDGLKATIDTLHRDFPVILSSYEKASTTIDKFKELEEKEKFIKGKHPQRMEAVEPLVSGIFKTKKTMAKAQQREKYLEEKISRLQVELENTKMMIEDCEVSLLSLEKQKKQFHENATGLKIEFEAVKKERSAMFEDQRNAWREFVKVDDKWSALCSEFQENLIAARNLS